MTPTPSITPAPQLCPACSYDLRAASSPRCPECGLHLRSHPDTHSRIPWVHRHHLGLRRAYFQTLTLILFHPKRLATELTHRVSRTHAQSFARLNFLLTLLLGTTLLLIAHSLSNPETWFKHIRLDPTPIFRTNPDGSESTTVIGHIETFSWPINIMLRGPQIAFALALWLAISWPLSMLYFRWLLSAGRNLKRRRTWRLSAYAWIIPPFTTTLAGLATISLALAEAPRWPLPIANTFPTVVYIALYTTAALSFLIPFIRLIGAFTKSWRIPLAVALIIGAYLLIGLWLFTFYLSLWLTGFLALLIRSLFAT